MKILLIIAAALLPAILLWLYIWKKDTQKEPTAWLVKAVLWGVAICIPVALVEGGIETLLFGVDGKPSGLLGTTTLAFVVAALPEETFKLFALWMVLRKNPCFFVLIYFCVKIHKVAKRKVLALIKKDRENQFWV
jgi:RsiW-degrading membrane proteinase PrsW (M82 family)